MNHMNHERYMKEALACAEQGVGHVNPNPLVGALVVADGTIIGRGYHEKYGEAHAERNALAACAVSPQGATLYVTLEPCSHYGKTPPCVEAIIESGIAQVVIAARDPNPQVSGRGVETLREAGIEVISGVLEHEAHKQNHVFFHYIQTGLPYVVMKYAMTLDGKTATAQGFSQWITGEKARMRVHQDRSRYCAIMVGSNTVLADNPLLTARIEGGRNPVRVICDSNLRTPFESQLVQTASDIPTIIATSVSDEAFLKAYRARGVQILTISRCGMHLDLSVLMQQLGREGIDGILLESGGVLSWSMLEMGLVNRIQAYIAPKIFGGAGASTPVMGEGVLLPQDAFLLEDMSVSFEGDDMLVEAEVRHNVHRNS